MLRILFLHCGLGKDLYRFHIILSMINNNKVSKIILYVSLLAFIAFAVYILYINREVFYTAHDRSEFIFGAPFFHTLMSKPFGLMQYVGAWLTQLCYRPLLGASVMIVIWTLIFYVGTKAFRLQASTSALMLLPIACLLTSVVDLGYWIYISTIRGYWFSQSVGYLVMLLLLWAARSTSRKWHLLWYVLGFCIYPILGWFALLFVLCLVVAEKPTWRELIGIVLLIFTASIWHTQLYSNQKFDDVVLAGLPRFETPSDSSPHLSIPFWVLGGASLLFALCGKYMSTKVQSSWTSQVAKPSAKLKVQSIIVPVLCAVAGIIFTWSLMYYDRNYIDEMRMVRYASDDNWKEVIRMSEENKKPTGTMVFLKNIALMNEGGLLDRSFKLGNDAVNINNPDTLHALATGDKKLVERYTTILHHRPFYGNWQPASVTAKVKELQKCYPDEITGVENSDSYIVNGISLWYESDSKLASEQALFYSMMRCDSRRFWASLRNYVELHLDEQFPLHAMEAYILYMDKAPEEKRMMLPVEQSVFERYKKFWSTLRALAKPGMTLKSVGEEMRNEYGDTYWWYNIFGKKLYIINNGNIGHEIQS